MKKCIQNKDLASGRRIHAITIKSGYGGDAFLATHLMGLYASHGRLEEAMGVFTKIPTPDAYNWATIIFAHAGHDEAAQAIRLYRQMWYAQQGKGYEALSLYNSMQQEGLSPDCVTHVCLLQACASVGVGAVHKGRQLHAQIVDRCVKIDEIVGGSLVNMYAKCGSLEDARRVFDKLSERSLVAWTSLIAGYAHEGMGQEALRLYTMMQQEGLIPDFVTYVCLLQACASVGVGALHVGKQLHAHIGEQGLEEDAVLGGSLVNMYAKCGSLEDARRLFDKLAEKNVVAWNTITAGYAEQEMGEEALQLYSSMQEEGLTPNTVTYISLLQACAALAALYLGEQMHVRIEESGVQVDGPLGSALVDMYAKCGSMRNSHRVFDSLSERSVETWGALISGYAHQGDSQVVFDLLVNMMSEGIRPDGMTFLSILTVCSHVGLVDKGRHYFRAMATEYGIFATMEHYICMVDLLGRAGHLHEALQMVKNMPFPPNGLVWHALLGSCHKWKNVEVGEQAFQGAVSVDERDASAYVLMSNIYASTCMWEAAKEVKARRLKFGAWKKPGQSWWTDMEGVVHTFLVADRKHPESGGIYGRLAELIPKINKDTFLTWSRRCWMCLTRRS